MKLLLRRDQRSGLIGKVIFTLEVRADLSDDERKAVLIARKRNLEDLRRDDASTNWRTIAERFELSLAALRGYEIGNDDEKRDVLKSVSSNLVARGKQALFPMFSPFRELRDWVNSTNGARSKTELEPVSK